MKRKPILVPVLLLAVAASAASTTAQEPDVDRVTPRRPAGDDDLRFWLDNMVRWHRFTVDEVAQATGLPPTEIESSLERFKIRAGDVASPNAGGPLVVMPYPGGRHPRIGFRDGAIDPQRETKLSVFLPWDLASYVVADVPEAVWSNLGLTYLAHTHVPTIWTKAGVELPPLEWERRDGEFYLVRTLPEVARLETRARPTPEGVRMRLTLTNLSRATLSDLRVQNCVMLKGAPEWAAQTNENKLFRPPYGVCRNEAGDHWLIVAWEPSQRVWGNAPCPCLHADPQFADCPRGESREVVGWLSFYHGTDIDAELARLDELDWRTFAEP